jgi:hypothetical protein
MGTETIVKYSPSRRRRNRLIALTIFRKPAKGLPQIALGGAHQPNRQKWGVVEAQSGASDYPRDNRGRHL